MKYFNNFSKSRALGMCLMKASIDTFSSFPVAFQKGLKDVSLPCLTSPGKRGFQSCPCCLLPFPFDGHHEPLRPAHDTNLLHPMS